MNNIRSEVFVFLASTLALVYFDTVPAVLIITLLWYLRGIARVKRISTFRKIFFRDGLSGDIRWGGARRRGPPLRGLVRFADWFGLDTRKAIKALAGDFSVEIRRLRRERRDYVANWNLILAWGYAIWYVFRAPFDFILNTATRLFKGS